MNILINKNYFFIQNKCRRLVNRKSSCCNWPANVSINTSNIDSIFQFSTNCFPLSLQTLTFYTIWWITEIMIKKYLSKYKVKQLSYQSETFSIQNQLKMLGLSKNLKKFKNWIFFLNTIICYFTYIYHIFALNKKKGFSNELFKKFDI